MGRVKIDETLTQSRSGNSAIYPIGKEKDFFGIKLTELGLNNRKKLGFDCEKCYNKGDFCNKCIDYGKYRQAQHR